MKYDIKDINLAEQGRKKAEWASKEMPVLKLIKERFLEEKPLKDVKISGCLHVTSETANLALTLKAAGAKFSLCASNPLSTQDDIAAYLVSENIPVFAITGEDKKTYYKHINSVVEEKPNITIDDGADLVAYLHQEKPEFMSEIIGGMEETTTGVIRLKALAKEKKLKGALIDLDPQGNATTGLGLSNAENSELTIYSVLNGNKKISEVIQSTKFENLNLITSNVDLSGLEIETAGDNRRAFKLKDELASILNDSRASYDYILIDCPPSLSLLTIMALVASNELVVPLQTEFFALEGLTQLMKTIERIKSNLNPSLNIRGILLTMYDKRNKLSGEVEQEARNYFKEKVYSIVVPRNVRLSEAPSHGVPVLVYDKSCPGSKAYFNFTDEFLDQDKPVETAA